MKQVVPAMAKRLKIVSLTLVVSWATWVAEKLGRAKHGLRKRGKIFNAFWGEGGAGWGGGDRGPHRIGVRGINVVGDRGSAGLACSALRLAPPVLCEDPIPSIWFMSLLFIYFRGIWPAPGPIRSDR